MDAAANNGAVRLPAAEAARGCRLSAGALLSPFAACLSCSKGSGHVAAAAASVSDSAAWRMYSPPLAAALWHVQASCIALSALEQQPRTCRNCRNSRKFPSCITAECKTVMRHSLQRTYLQLDMRTAAHWCPKPCSLASSKLTMLLIYSLHAVNLINY